MKPTARLIHASRGPIVEEQALISVLKNEKIAGAAIDVFDIEPLPSSHPCRTHDNVLATPHLGYVSHGLYTTFYEDTCCAQIFRTKTSLIRSSVVLKPLSTVQSWRIAQS
jgi:phosphoglycerate dehydrogenase-like enzyme